MSTHPVVRKRKNNVKWNSDDIKCFLEIFMNHESLWNAKHPHYLNRQKRDFSLKKLMKELEDCGIQVGKISILRQKIKNIRNTYRQEYLKVNASRMSGVDADEVYKPKLTWFKIADSFLSDFVARRSSNMSLLADQSLWTLSQDIPRIVSSESVKNTREEEEEEEDEEEDEEVEEGDDDDEDESVKSVKRTANREINEPSCVASKKWCYRTARVDYGSKKFQNMCDSRAQTNVSTVNLDRPDEYDLFANHIAMQLRHLPVKSFIILQEKFQSLLTVERLACLNGQSTSASSFYEGFPVVESLQVEKNEDLSGSGSNDIKDLSV